MLCSHLFCLECSIQYFFSVIENLLIAYEPHETVGIDEDNCLLLGCISYYHCTMEVNYLWFLNGSLLKKGRKANLVYVQEPGQYQCVLTVNDHVAKSEIIKVIVEEKCIEDAAVDGKLHNSTKSAPPNHQEKDGTVMYLL